MGSLFRGLGKTDGGYDRRRGQGKDRTAEEVIYRYIRSLCTGITNITNIFRPDLVLLSGNLFSQNEYLLEEIHSFIEKECFGRHGTGVPEIKAVKDSKNAGLTGAANLI